MRLLLPAAGFPPLFYEINLSEEPAALATASWEKPICAPTANSA
jgi:hypothetical protein